MLDLAHLFGRLRDADVRYVAIGGIAVGVHGYVRMTLDFDIDIVPDPTGPTSSA